MSLVNNAVNFLTKHNILEKLRQDRSTYLAKASKRVSLLENLHFDIMKDATRLYDNYEQLEERNAKRVPDNNFV